VNLLAAGLPYGPARCRTSSIWRAFLPGESPLMGRLALVLTSVRHHGRACRVRLEWSWSSVWLFVAAYLLLTNGIYTVAAGELLFPSIEGNSHRWKVLGALAAASPNTWWRGSHSYWCWRCARQLFVPLPIFLPRLFFFTEQSCWNRQHPSPVFGAAVAWCYFEAGLALIGLASLCAPFLFACRRRHRQRCAGGSWMTQDSRATHRSRLDIDI